MATNNSLNINSEGLQVFDPSTGDFTAVDLTTKGDILVYNGTSYQRLEVGTDDQVLTADSAQTEGVKWADSGGGGGAWNYITSQTASASSSLEFTSNIDSTYINYKFVLTDIRIATSQEVLTVETSSDNGSNWDTTSDDYEWFSNLLNWNNDNTIFGEGRTSVWIGNPFDNSFNWGNSTNDKGSGEFYFYNPSDTSYSKFSWNIVYVSAGGRMSSSIGNGLRKEASAVNGVRFISSSGNITSGTIRMYGLSPS